MFTVIAVVRCLSVDSDYHSSNGEGCMMDIGIANENTIRIVRLTSNIGRSIALILQISVMRENNLIGAISYPIFECKETLTVLVISAMVEHSLGPAI